MRFLAMSLLGSAHQPMMVCIQMQHFVGCSTVCHAYFSVFKIIMSANQPGNRTLVGLCCCPDMLGCIARIDIGNSEI